MLESEWRVNEDVDGTTALVRNVFYSVWQEFWEQDTIDSQTSINALACSSPRRGPPLNLSESLSTNLSFHRETGPQTTAQRGPDDDPASEIWITEEFLPCPPYESCTPSGQSIYHGDDPDLMPFIPFADDVQFDYVDHSSHYREFAWQSSNKRDSQWLLLDPDLQIMLLKAVHVLRTTHGLSYTEIDDTRVLPITIVTQTHQRLLHISRQRDYPILPGFPDSHLRDDNHISASDTRTRLVNATVSFCANLNCIQGFCARHLEPSPMPSICHPTMTSDKLLKDRDWPCSENCFASQHIAPQVVNWNESDIQTLRDILKVIPHTLPCYLAIICRKPCREILYFRRTLLPDRLIRRRIRSKTTSIPSIPAICLANTPGPAHQVPVARAFSTPCSVNGIAPVALNASGAGVVASVRHGSAVKHATPNVVHVLEQTENVIRNCVGLVYQDVGADLCRNSALQQGRRKNTKVIPTGNLGYGLLLTEPVIKGDLITEYVGELILEPTTLSRDSVSIHRRRNYLFGLDPLLSIDGAYVGNESRYCNHSREANAVAKIWHVNGDNRIGIYALHDLSAATEVVIDYGNGFFLEDSPE